MLVDIIPKLYALHRVGLDPASLVYLIPADTRPFGHAWLAMVGIRPDQLLTYDPHGEIIVAEELIVPTLLRFGSRAASVFRDAVGFMIAAMGSRAGPAGAPATPECIFVSRARAGRDGRTMRHRGEIEAIAADHGYSIVHPEQMPLDEQVALFRGARRIVGEYGSAMHTAIFAPPGATLCCLRGAARHPAFLQSGLAQVLDQECGYVLGDAPLDAYEYEFAIAADDFQRALRLMKIGALPQTPPGAEPLDLVPNSLE